jgi:homogentisate 1,2-dioxygenase
VSASSGPVLAPLASLPEELRRLGARRVLLVSSSTSRRYAEVTALLRDFAVTPFTGARRHVPEAVVAEAKAALAASQADTIVTFGGGSATGLGKALRLEADVRFVAVPTTYAGSERTSIFGITSAGAKRTGRDPRVRPDHVLYDETLTLDMPKALSIASLFNALAHPIGALESASLSAEDQDSAYRAITLIYAAVEALLEAPDDRAARARALSGAALAADALERGRPGAHHALAHELGGRFDLDHSGLHSVLLPHSFARLRGSAPHVVDSVSKRLGVRDVEAMLFDFLRRSGAATSLRELGLPRAALNDLSRALSEPLGAQVRAAFHGRRPSADTRREDFGLDELVSLRGPAFEQASRVIVALHGRTEAADAALSRVVELSGNDRNVAIVAPQAASGAWYSGRYHEGREGLGAELSAAAGEIQRVLAAIAARVPPERLVLFGFSQGACLALEVFRSVTPRPATLVALAGAALGRGDELSGLPSLPGETRVLLSASEGDPWVAIEHVEHTAKALSELGAQVTLVREPGDGHEPSFRARHAARALLTGVPPAPPLVGFGNFHETEALPGALPHAQNTPRNAPYGLYPEQINGTSFVAPRHENQRSWTYRVRPSAQHGDYTPLVHATLRADFVNSAPEPDLTGFTPLAAPPQPADFVDGLITVGGAGDPRARRGFALHLYALNRGMEARAFYDADGDLLILPELSALTLLTELGVLEVPPGTLAGIPRGVRFSVFPHEREARGYVAEVFGRHFTLPERGPVGANGLTDARHFRAPAAFHEDRLLRDFRVTAKFGGELFDTTQDYSPFDVAAWHGNYAPYSYDLSLFSPVNNTRIDHGDPSVYTVLSAPLDRDGENNLDLVVFPPRWDATENTFRPPFFHRNVTTEFNGIIREQSTHHPVFRPGGVFITPSMTPHGVVAENVERAFAADDEHANRPHRTSDRALWFQFETSLPLCLSSWARTTKTRVPHFGRMFRAYRTHFSS